MATVAKLRRQKRALDRFVILKRDAFWPKTNIRRFKSDDEHEIYIVRKVREKSALQVAVRVGEAA